MLKRFISMLLAFVMMLSLVGCGVVIEVPDYTATALDLMTVIDEVCQARYEEICTPIEEGNFTDFLVDDPSTANLLSDEEVSLLTDFNSSSLKNLTKEEAISDISILFRALHSGYGAYYYFGEEKFSAAELQLYQWVEEQSHNIKGADFTRQLIQALSFVEDAHFMIHGDNITNFDQTNIRWEYFYCDGFEFEKDENGFYQIDDAGMKWYISAISDDRVTIERSLMADGRIVYAPVLFCTRPTMENSTVTLTSAAGDSREYRLAWKESDHIERGEVYRFLQKQGVTYVAVQDFHGEHKEQLDQYAADAALTRSSKVIIYDLRNNCGGGDEWARDWVANYLNAPRDKLQMKTLFSNRSSKLFDALGYSVPTEHGFYEYNPINGIWHENDVPIIVLMDDGCGSAGEDALKLLETMDNVIVIGSNSAGYQICGNQFGIRLPNSEIVFEFGCSLNFKEKIENVDFRGYEPDIWCNPVDVLDAVMNMLAYYGLAEMEEIVSVIGELETNQPSEKSRETGLYLRFQSNSDVFPGESFGAGGPESNFTVMYDGKMIKDFTVESENEDVCTLKKLTVGKVFIKRVNIGSSWITVTYQGESARFLWNQY